MNISEFQLNYHYCINHWSLQHKKIETYTSKWVPKLYVNSYTLIEIILIENNGTLRYEKLWNVIIRIMWNNVKLKREVLSLQIYHITNLHLHQSFVKWNNIMFLPIIWNKKSILYEHVILTVLIINIIIIIYNILIF